MPVEQELFEVELACESSTGCGITIVGSRSSGIAIKSLHPGGVADLDGRLKVGDKLVLVDGKRAGLMTPAQVARYLRKHKRVHLQLYRPDYDLLTGRNYHHSNSKKSYSSIINHSYTFSTISDLQTELDMEVEAPSAEFDSLSAVPTTSPATSCSNLLERSPIRNGRYSRMITSTSRSTSSTAGLTVPDHSRSEKSFSFYYSGFNKLRKMMNIFPANHSREDVGDHDIELMTSTKYRSLFNSSSVSSEISTPDTESFRVDSSEELISTLSM